MSGRMHDAAIRLIETFFIVVVKQPFDERSVVRRASNHLPYLRLRTSVIQLGDLSLQRVSGGRFRLDGGAMFGVVPKPLWSKVSSADDANRIQLDTNCIVVRNQSDVILIDSGFGTTLSTEEKGHLAVEQPNDLLANLKSIGITRDQISIVIASHMHFDHVGGLTISATTDSSESTDLEPTFPNARHIVQQSEHEDALGSRPELKGNYPYRELLVIEQAGLFEPVDGRQEVSPGVFVECSGGHTRGHQLIYLQSKGESAVYVGDLCPTTAHLRTFWTMAYDQFPLDVRIQKPRVLKRAIEEQQLVLFDHDPTIYGAYLERDERGGFAVSKSLSTTSA